MPWLKHEHSDIVVPQLPTCGMCGRVVDEMQYHCAEMNCPYPYPPPAEVVEEAPVEPEPDVPAAADESTPEPT